VNWVEIAAKQSATRATGTKPALIPERTTPTLFLDYDGTLHAGYADEDNPLRVGQMHDFTLYQPAGTISERRRVP
jgi:hypothetical protein